MEKPVKSGTLRVLIAALSAAAVMDAMGMS